MLRTPTPACAGIVIVLLWLSGGGAARPGVEAGLAAAGQEQEFVPITDEMLRDPDPADWLMAYRTYDFQAFSPLTRSTATTSGSSGSPGCARWKRGPSRSGPWSTTA